LGWDRFFLRQRTPSSIHPFLHCLPHPTWQYLARLVCHGAPSVLHSPPWSHTHKDQAVLRGQHASAARQYKKKNYWKICSTTAPYYRVPISATAALHLAVVLPTDQGVDPLITLPLSLLMGWSQSPPYFCAFTETVTDIANNTPTLDTPHPLIAQTQATISPAATPAAFHKQAITLPFTSSTPLQYTDIYLDDFITVAQCPSHLPALNAVLYAIDTVFHDPINSP